VRTRRGHKTAVLAAMLVAALASAGCGAGADGSRPERESPGSATATLWITRDYGRVTLSDERVPVDSHTTAAQLLDAHHEVVLDDTFGLVRAIDGRRASAAYAAEIDDRQTRWGFYVNGVKMQSPVDELPVFSGDVVHFDLADMGASYVVRGSVGAFPRPFDHMVSGGRPRVRITCVAGRSACSRVRTKVVEAGVQPIGKRRSQPRSTAQIRRIRSREVRIRRVGMVVGTWSSIRRLPVLRAVEEDPFKAGVFADFDRTGKRVRVLGWDGRAVRTMGPGTGVLAMFRSSLHDVTWLVTGTDRAGVASAAAALGSPGLRRWFGAVTRAGGGAVERLPAAPSERRSRASRTKAWGQSLGAPRYGRCARASRKRAAVRSPGHARGRRCAARRRCRATGM
jgi:hypothetical protein